MIRENMFRINLDDEVNAIDHQSLILRRESVALAEKRKELDKDFEKAIHKSINKGVGKMLLRSLAPLIMLVIGMIMVSQTIERFEATGAIPPVLAIAAGVFIVASLILFYINRKKEKAEENEDNDEPDEALDSVDGAYETFNKQVKQELRVPFDAVEVEVFTTMLSKDFDKKRRFAYTNDTPTAFVEDGKLCFWYNGAVVGFPMSEIEALVKVNDSITFDSWMADDPYDGLKYAKYGITMKEVEYEEHYTMNGYYSLRFTHEGEPFELLFPLFDAEKLLALLDCKIVEE